jgi:cell division protein ZapA (FtsZ GTPase activity inhibitor)
MTQMSQEVEFNVLGCRVKVQPDQEDSHIARSVVDLVNSEVIKLKSARPTLKDTDVAILVALKIATENKHLELEYKKNILMLEESLQKALELIEAK